jgi:hypothetical protein
VEWGLGLGLLGWRINWVSEECVCFIKGLYGTLCQIWQIVVIEQYWE